MVFENTKVSTQWVIHKTSALAMDMTVTINQFRVYTFDPINSRWSPPVPGFFKLNVNGGFRDGRNFYGGVLRNNQGHWQ